MSAVRLAHLPTPLEPLDRLAEELGGPRLLVKRDDCTGLALGGNKARKLELLCAEALDEGCDTLVTGGGPQSNHVRMTAAAANRLGLACEVVLAGHADGGGFADRRRRSRSAATATGDAGERKSLPSGNLVLDRLLGARLHFTGASEYYAIEADIEALAARLAREGRRPFAIPVGGASVTGVLAYVDAATELEDQLRDDVVDWVVVADGSGGTHAGLLAGFGDRPRVLGVDVGTRPDLDDVVPRLAEEAAARRGCPAPIAPVEIDHERCSGGYGALTAEARDAILLAARREGLVLDPVYTGKAMAGLVAAVRTGRFRSGETVVFWHTGGAPALFASRYGADLAELD